VEFILEVLFEIFGEVLIQLLFECLAELGVRSLADTLEKPRHPLLSTIGFALWGALAGGLSLLIFPHSAIASAPLRRANLVVTPIIVGLAMMLIGRVRSKKGQDLVRLDRFGYAFVFAFAMALVRFVWAH
jgi:hypothetical protein